jgi:hypothetical protein
MQLAVPIAPRPVFQTPYAAIANQRTVLLSLCGLVARDKEDPVPDPDFKYTACAVNESQKIGQGLASRVTAFSFEYCLYVSNLVKTSFLVCVDHAPHKPHATLPRLNYMGVTVRATNTARNRLSLYVAL